MSDYIVVAEGRNNILVVRTSDWQVVARCTNQAFANQVAAALNA